MPLFPTEDQDQDQEQEQDTRLALISTHGTSVDIVSRTGVRVRPVDVEDTSNA